MSCRNLLRAAVFFTLLLFAHLSYSQDRVITGKVTDPKDGSGIPGVNVTPKGGSGGTQTNTDGSYRISVGPAVTVLVFSAAEFTTQEINIAGRTSADVSLAATTGSLGEIVVIGYGTTRKKDLTGSISTVNAKDFQKGNITTPEQLIAGKVAGVSIISNGGQPGSGSTIRIRGGSSLPGGGSNDPLIVIDGVPVDNGGIAGGNNPLSFINANDIESFTVLKDASAAAIYGTRASNGVIIITTRKGKSGAFKANFTSTNSLSVNSNKVDVLSGDQVRAIVNEKGTSTQKAQLGTANTDWQDEIYQKAFATDNNIGFTGGIKGLPYRASVGYLNQEGVLRTDHLEKISLALVLNPTFFDNHLKVDLNLKGAQQKYRFADRGAIGASVNFDPTKPVYSGNKRYNGYFEWLDPNPGTTFGFPYNRAGRNPVALLTDRFDESNSKRSIGNLQLDYKFHFLPDLRANLNLGYDISKGTGQTFISDSSSISYVDSGYFKEYQQTKGNTVFEFYLNYVKDIPSIKSRIDIMAGYSHNHYLTREYGFPTFTARGVKKVGSDPNNRFTDFENNLISYFGRFNYTFYDKYLLTATLRRDGSSKFGPENKWGLFPAAALAWKIKDESFLKNSRLFSDLKLRLGYGITGQQDGIANFIYLSYYSLSNLTATYPFGNNYYQMYRPAGRNEGIKWEETATANVAVDYGFLNNRITGSIDFYIKKTKDLFQSVPQGAATNFSAFITANVGSMTNKGVEFNIAAQPVLTKNFTWDVAFNATYNKNTITKLTVVPDDNYKGFPTTNIAGSQGFAFINAVGGSKNTFYLYHQIYDSNGKPIEGLFEDVNRDGIINENDKYKGKRADPNMFFGFSTSATYKKWSAGFVLRSSFNNYIYNNIYSNNGRLNQVLNAYVLGNASSNYLETGFTGATEQQPLSDYYIQNASFLKMDNLNVGYNAGQVLKQKATLRLNFTVQNVFVITKYTGLDPEISGGVDNNFYPRPRIFSLGLNLDF
jgi:TonB-dependent starch-binding outer membrane protein SusC